jgi:xanthine/CO dehydrogenase XdhC/CoxF family maturation factor
MTERERPRALGPGSAGRLVVVTRNPISEAVTVIAEAAGRPVTLIEGGEGDAGGRAGLGDLSLTDADAVVLCDHDAPEAPRILRDALGSRASYVAMLASRGRAEAVLAELRDEGYDETALARLRMPAGLDVGGKSPGEIALSVVAEVVATSYGRPGGPMRSS